jgi:diguanylate cyclase (GGDEF)-like protein
LTVIAVGTASLSLLVLARLVGMVGILARDVAKRRALEAQLTHQAFHDPLTALMNRRGFLDAAQTALSSRTATGTVAALFLDLDDFKTINDSLGHAAGDTVLVAVAHRIRAHLRSTDVAARLGGDEFGVLLTGIPDQAFAVSIAERLLGELQTPIGISGATVRVGSSVGIAIDRAATRTVDDLLGDADVAMYQAKGLGKGRYEVFAAGASHGTSLRPDVSETSPAFRRSSSNRVAATARL